MKVLQDNIINLRKAQNMTQRELSMKLGVTFQTVSKWENGNSLPDITLLPTLAETFHVSVDQLLGILPIDDKNYRERNKDTSEYRDRILKQFTATRELFWNVDYLEFMVREAWKITTPIMMAEVGCGNGQFAEQILPLLPKGSKYVGYEKSKVMLEDGQSRFADNGKVTILPFDEMEDVREKFDLVICQGYLRHLNNPEIGIDLMIKITKKGGIVIGHEENRPFENVGLLLGDEMDDSFEKGLFLEKMWNNELIREGRDYRIGLRLPVLLKKAGLKDIKCRMNDRVDLILNRDEKEELERLQAHYEITSIKEEQLADFVMERGLTRYEGHRYVELYNKRKSYMGQNIEEVSLVHVMGLIISWGIKPYD
ncbi:helix-turn-helix domain-containing protein [Pseudoneobacillus sp. C159]